MDPLGFALENFDGHRPWRDVEAGSRDDASGALPDGTNSTARRHSRRRWPSEPGCRCDNRDGETSDLCARAGLEYYDMPVIRKITRDAARKDYRWSSLILGIVRSTPFQMKREGQ